MEEVKGEGEVIFRLEGLSPLEGGEEEEAKVEKEAKEAEEEIPG